MNYHIAILKTKALIGSKNDIIKYLLPYYNRGLVNGYDFEMYSINDETLTPKTYNESIAIVSSICKIQRSMSLNRFIPQYKINNLLGSCLEASEVFEIDIDKEFIDKDNTKFKNIITLKI